MYVLFGIESTRFIHTYEIKFTHLKTFTACLRATCMRTGSNTIS